MNLQALPEEALKEILALTEAKKKLDLREEAENFFMPFAHHVYENFIEGRHHRIIGAIQSSRLFRPHTTRNLLYGLDVRFET